jgi:glycosyltransferase involved in cell wall biosynthesis
MRPTRRDGAPSAAIVHDFFIQDGGAERCAIEFARILPAAAIETTFFDSARFGDRIDPRRVRTWPLQRLLGPTERFRALLPLYPVWFTARDLRRYDLVLSSSIAFAKSVRTRRGALHVSYVYTPMRYAWDLDTYLEGSSLGLAARLAARTVRPLLRRWDVSSGHRPDVVVAISEYIRGRLADTWQRTADAVIYPPVDTESIPLSHADDGFLLVAARLLAYRRIDLAVAAATRLGRELVIVGDGPERARLEGVAGPTVHFLGRVDRDRLVDLFQRCHAYVLPGLEDFGIAPVEAMAAGRPVIAFDGGGARETVIEGVTGTFFEHQSVDAVTAAIERLDGLPIDRNRIRAQAKRFDRKVFVDQWRALFERLGVDPSLYSAE